MATDFNTLEKYFQSKLAIFSDMSSYPKEKGGEREFDGGHPSAFLGCS